MKYTILFNEDVDENKDYFGHKFAQYVIFDSVKDALVSAWGFHETCIDLDYARIIGEDKNVYVTLNF